MQTETDRDDRQHREHCSVDTEARQAQHRSRQSCAQAQQQRRQPRDHAANRQLGAASGEYINRQSHKAEVREAEMACTDRSSPLRMRHVACSLESYPLPPLGIPERRPAGAPMQPSTRLAQREIGEGGRGAVYRAPES